MGVFARDEYVYGYNGQDENYSDGRFYITHEWEHNFVNMTRTARHHLAKALNWHSYDLEAAHPTMILQIAERSDITLPHLINYVDNKAIVRRAVKDQTECTDQQVKDAFNATIYGSALSRGFPAELRLSLIHI